MTNRQAIIVRPWRLISEMPHIELNRDVEGQKFGLIDLRVERYPVSQEEKRKLLHAFHTGGIVAPWKSKFLFFSPEGEVRWASKEELDSVERLPSDWEKYMLNVTDEGRRTPRMTEVFKRR